MFTKHILINYLLKEEEFWFSCNLFGNRFQNSSTVGYGGVAQWLGCRSLAVGHWLLIWAVHPAHKGCMLAELGLTLTSSKVVKGMSSLATDFS